MRKRMIGRERRMMGILGRKENRRIGKERRIDQKKKEKSIV